ncbi:MAG: hypothetical protein NXI20_05560 [bacterium]|nr:hypothetical protein [bacterium]
MANKVLWYHHWDWKTIALTSIILIAALLLFTLFFLPDITREWKLSRFKGENIGFITNVKENDMIRQSQYGSYNAIDSYEVSYQYYVNGASYFGREKIQGSRQNSLRLKKIMSNERKVVVKYYISRPKRSMLDLDGK